MVISTKPHYQIFEETFEGTYYFFLVCTSELAPRGVRFLKKRVFTNVSVCLKNFLCEI